MSTGAAAHAQPSYEAQPPRDGQQASHRGWLRSLGRRLLTGALHRWLVLVVALLCWEAATHWGEWLLFPPPTEIAATMYAMWFSGPPSDAFLTAEAIGNIGPSLARTLGGWAIASALGIGVGIWLGRRPHARQYAHPLLELGRVIPPPTLIPVFLVLFGIGSPLQVATISFAAVWPVLLNTIDGARFVDRSYLDTADIFGISPARRLLRIVLPAAGPKIFAGLRVSLSIALILMVISEMVGARNGIGYALITAQHSFEYVEMWAGIVLLGILGYGLNAALLAVEKRILGWHRGAQRAE